MTTMLNCGRELGEIVELVRTTQIVTGESPNESYLPEDEKVWTYETVPFERRDGSLVIDDWDELSGEAQRAILDRHDGVLVDESEVMELVE